MKVLDRLREKLRSVFRSEPPIDEYVHADIGRVMQHVIGRMPEYSQLRYKESLVPEKARANGEGLGITEYGNWRNILKEIEAEVHRATRAKQHTKPAYMKLDIPSSDKQASLSQSLGSTRRLIAGLILKDISKIPTS